VGVPVFAGFEAGFGVLAGPTGGYIFGYIANAWLVGILSGKSKEIHPARLVIALVAGTIATYAIGTAWFMAVTNMSFAAAFVLCVLPFLLGDTAKMAIVFFVGRVLRRRMGVGLSASPSKERTSPEIHEKEGSKMPDDV
jgi:biotin transport system substrate-specific component